MSTTRRHPTHRWFKVCLAKGAVAAALTLALVGGATRGRADPVTAISNGGFEQIGADGFPLDWAPVGETATVTSDAHSGRAALRLVRRPDTAAVETGANRAWRPDSAERGAMLDQLKGGIVFYYKAIAQAEPGTLTVQIIPMSARPWEDTGSERMAFRVPDGEVGDDQWRRGAVKYDFTGNPRVKWVQVSPRVLGPGELLLDDFEWVEKVGPLLSIKQVMFTESAGAPGREAKITVVVENRGDERVGRDRLTAEVPEGLEVLPREAEVPVLDAGQAQEFSFALRGARVREGVVRLRLGSAGVTASLALRAAAMLDRVMVDSFIVAPGEQTTLRVTLANSGRTILRGVSVDAAGRGAMVGEPSREQAPELAPGRKATLEWKVSTPSEGFDAAVEVTADLPGGSARQRVGLICLAPGEEMTLSDGRRTLAVCKTSRGYGLCEVRAKRAGAEAILAKMPYLARLVFAAPSGRRYDIPLYGQQAERLANALAFTSDFTDAEGASWRFRAEFRLTARGRFALRYVLGVDQARELLAFDGPMVYVAEGTAATRRDAIFPGLEWLAQGEDSSSSLDIAPDHPDRLRYVPHPNKVTIPLMAVRTDDGLVALLWDPRQKWDGTRDRPAAVFASPDRFEQRASHLLGLALPSVPEFMAQNERLARHPYPMRPGQDIALIATMLVEPDAPDALVAQDAWIEQFGLPDPEPYPHGAPEAEISFGAQAYLDSLWLPREKMWLPFKGGPQIWMNPSRDATFIQDLVIASVLAPDEATRQACKQRLDVLAAEGALPSPTPDDLGFDCGRPDQGLAMLVSQACARMDSQGTDGAWRFDANLKDQGVFKGMDYHELGADKAAEVGTCARAAYEILLAARMTGDREAYAAGVRALRFMEQFSVPRAAQVWEVPVHTPDILAAADAVDAYLEAYRIDGDRRWLGDAVRWARAGLPFVYLWNVAEYRFMRYASIPVFGASWLKWSWFGRAVQWNGLRYGYALLKLSEYDAAMPAGGAPPWRKIAEGLTISAMYQQATAPPDVALWPDSISMTDASKAAWIFAPRLILKNVYYLLGRPQEPGTVVVQTSNGAITIDSGAPVSGAAFSGAELRFRLTYPRAKSGATAVVGVTRPRSVLVDGVPAQAVADAKPSQAPTYRYAPAMNLLFVNIGSDGAHEVRVIGAAPARAELLPQPRSSVAFDFRESAGGWSATNDLAPFDFSGGMLTTTATGGDPYMTRGRMQVDGDGVKAIVVRMAVTGGEYAQFYWGTQQAPGFSEERVAKFGIQPDGQLHEYRIEVGADPQWRGQKIVALRLDPTNGAPRANIRIAWIKNE